MSVSVRFESQGGADAAREEFSEWVCPIDDDRRFKTVHFVSDTPESVMSQIEARADEGRADADDSPGQVELTDGELDRFDFSRDKVNVPYLQTIKGYATKFGVDDWTSRVDPTLTADEHESIMRSARSEGGGSRNAMDQLDADRERRAAQRVQEDQCNHAEGHCRNGDEDACEFLQDACGFDESEVNDLLARSDGGQMVESDDDLVTVGGDGDLDEMRVTPEQAGELSRSWQGYKGALAAFETHVEELRDVWHNAQQAARAINEIRLEAETPREPIHFDALEAAQADLLDFLRMAADDCHECHADHADHDHDVTSGDRESISTAVKEGFSETPVGVGDERPPSSELADREPVAPDQSSVGTVAMDDDDRSIDEREMQEEAARVALDGGSTTSFSPETQNTLDVGLDAETTAQNEQVTLTGEAESESVGALPSDWQRGDGKLFEAGPYGVLWSHSPERDRWRVILSGPDNSETLADGLRDEDRAEAIAAEFVERVAPDQVSFHNSDRIVPQAAAEAKQVTAPDDGGLSQFGDS